MTPIISNDNFNQKRYEASQRSEHHNKHHKLQIVYRDIRYIISWGRCFDIILDSLIS